MVKEFIGFAEMKNCIDMAVELCFDNGKYQAYMEDFAKWHSLAFFFSDEITEDMDINEEYQKLCDVEFRYKLMGSSQAEQILKAIESAIEMKKNKEMRFGKLADLIDELFARLDNQETVDKIAEWGKEFGVEIDGEEKEI